jgi:hypothetical protein
MNCYDCQDLLGRDTPAVGTCAHCGMGVCSEHSEAVRPTVRRFSGMTAARVGKQPRRILCPSCYDADRSVAVSA